MAAEKTNSGLSKPLTPSAKLAVIVGAKPLSRADAIKGLWAYVKKNNLQDASNKRNINADASLKDLFDGKAQVSMFDLAKIISANLK
ncbi:MAG: SWIB/MDM2 domain-containing protein [Mycoplasmoidaceae bacterium]|nr:MAG: SWIB/MDM2 domain-containing protein [Mycoplasmoidaceae bacterium]